MVAVVGTDSRDNIGTTAPGDTVFALGGNDIIFGRHGQTTLIGGTGNDQYRLFDPHATVVEDADGGIDTIWAWDSIVLPDNVENVVFKRISEWHSVEGNDLDNLITAGDGRQALAGHGGNDTLTGGGGADDFYIYVAAGHDVITDFETDIDQLILWSTDLKTFADLLAASSQVGADTLITVSEDQSVRLEGVARDALTEDMVTFATPGSSVPAGATLVFADEFDSLQSLENWNLGPINGHPAFTELSRGKRDHTYVETLTYLDDDGVEVSLSPFSVEDGVMSIRAWRTPEQLQDAIPEDWISGSLDSHGLRAQTYGYFETRARLPEGQGLWPAFWLTPDDYTWPPELDIFDVMGDEINRLQPTVHSALWGDKVTTADQWLVPDMSENFHTYGMSWSEQEVVFYFDGIEVFRIDTPPDLHVPMALHINLAIGGWTGGPDETTPDGAAFEIDYVRVYDLAEAPTGDRPQNMDAFADIENGVMNTSAFARVDFYGDDVRRADATTPDLSLEDGALGTLVGDETANVLIGNDEGTVFNGRGGDDEIRAGAGDDYLIGEDGNDTLDGGQGADTMVGGLGDDTYVIRRGDGADSPLAELIMERPNEGVDTIHFADLLPEEISTHIDWARWRISIQGEDGVEYIAVRVTPGVDGSDLGSYIERATFMDGTVWDLTEGLFLSGDDANNASAGSAFDDTMTGGAGNDTMAGMNGDDTMDGGAGVDATYGWNGDDTLTDSGAEGGDRLFGENGNDMLFGGDGIDFLDGGAGEDTLRASRDGDVLHGGDDDDFMRGGRSSDTLTGGDGNDNMNGLAGDDSLSGDAGNDRVLGNAGADHLSGGDGRDALFGGTGKDVLLGDADDDKLFGGTGDDTLDGGAGRDRLRGEEGVDVFRFTLSEIENDMIEDFEAGERIEIYSNQSLTDLSFTLLRDRIEVTDLATEEVSTIHVVGVTEEDIALLPL